MNGLKWLFSKSIIHEEPQIPLLLHVAEQTVPLDSGRKPEICSL